jgi:DNA invertase Pin-like site-specific DNA recombinase
MERVAPMKAYAYLRVSGRGQVDGDGFPRQQAAIDRYAGAHEYQVMHTYREEALSGKTELENRPALQTMLTDLEENGVTVVMIEKLDRLARDLMVQETILGDLRRRGITLISVMEPDLCSDDPSRKLIRQIMGAIAEYDRCMIVARTRAARERIRASGRRCEGRKRYGERADELTTLTRILRMGSEGYTWSAIAAELNTCGLTSRYGGKWHPSQIGRILGRAS